MIGTVDFVNKTKEELTKEDLRSMIRVEYRKCISVAEMIDYYGIEVNEYYNFVVSKGLRLTGMERTELNKIRNEKRKETNEEYNRRKQAELKNKVPDFILCALYEVDFEYRNGQFYYDQEQLQHAREDAQSKILDYDEEKLNARFGEKKGEISNITNTDLVAMRYYRRISRKKLASKMLVTVPRIKEMESESPVSKDTAKCYMWELKIKNHHIKQLRKIMNGQSKEIYDSRTIPKPVKVAVWSRDKGKCSSCGSDKKLHYHHIEHYADGGQNKVKNLTLLCASCHAEVHKNDKSYHMLKSMAEG
ncbi:hypothetical protein GCM10007063_05720 [Lentibacillus kapialis]|uniref:HNH nuclease domain-containing protein n=1 Tax=Lentibacillus kapialis TaxID=340214 RepID=A0A917UU46_9BACI|nr:HNH endonuclease signature motif containing protein [Lentibacillus kapialis]GGJ86072.1 hypothetical protein GCM10007063_05720 [Lentibacillus kapialis]